MLWYWYYEIGFSGWGQRVDMEDYMRTHQSPQPDISSLLRYNKMVSTSWPFFIGGEVGVG